MPEHASQGMQAFKSKKTISREGSTTGLTVSRMTREKSGGMVRQKSGTIKRERSSGGSCEHDHTDRGTRLSTPGIRRGKSDLDREGKQIKTYKAKDYSGVRGSGYGVTHSTKKKTTEAKSIESGSSPAQPKITREKSGDVYSRLYGTSPKTTASRTSTTTRSSVSSSSGSSTKTSTTRTSVSGIKTTTPRRRTASGSEKTPATPKLSVTSPDDDTTPLKGSTTKAKTGGVFSRLSTQGTATKKASETPEKKTPNKTKTTTSKSTEPKKRGSAKK